MTIVNIALLLYLVLLQDGNYVDSMEKNSKQESCKRKVKQCQDEIPGLADVDIKNKESTEGYSFYRDGRVGIYYVRLGQSIRSVSQNETKIWRGSNESGNAKKVLVEGIGKSQKMVTVYLWTNETIKFLKQGKKKPWVEIKTYQERLLNDKFLQSKNNGETTKGSGVSEENSTDDHYDEDEDNRYKTCNEREVIPKTEYPPEITIIFENTDGEGDSDMYIVKHRRGSEVYDYYFASHAKCVAVKCEGYKLWRLEEDKNYPVTMSYRRGDNILTLRYKYGFDLYVKRLDRWMLHPYLSRIKREFSPYMKKRNIKARELNLKEKYE
ncbi:conserved hypothetical protein [Theileria orientalis strain Shintoku]|uniref:Signal peptide containing protein n=1 Tax=Theileria orientalis strain Shintoku TaxID=869250 RepID=J4C8Z4_THEOR|nr:conserved hypothetical protein [Theileria orientalis strain Shintoku]PVC52013.1 hypothetical protein MACL_00001071 [Theileria orientalis]BAM41643.1 conserved hypothetical protein [Theileria orientalis strain Shintoku]|eukprot:XP_009691944.1 conserved hypothetical protein [Theileria orientalis strain Shintoku]